MAFFACGTHFEQAPSRSGGLPRPDDSVFRVRRAEWNRVNGRAVGAPIVLKGTHFEQAPALPGLPGSATTRPFGPGGAEWNLVNEGADGALIILYICWERQVVGVVPVCCLKAWAKAAC